MKTMLVLVVTIASVACGPFDPNCGCSEPERRRGKSYAECIAECGSACLPGRECQSPTTHDAAADTEEP